MGFLYLSNGEINWNAVAAISNVLVAIATFAAVIVSLKIARDQKKEKLNIIGNTVYGNYSKSYGEDVHTFKVQNIGAGDVFIEELSFVEPKIIKLLAFRFGLSIKRPISIYYFIKALISKPQITWLPYEFTKNNRYIDCPNLPIELKSKHSLEFMIPFSYFQKTFFENIMFENAFTHKKEIILTIVILTGSGKYFRGKLKISNTTISPKT